MIIGLKNKYHGLDSSQVSYLWFQRETTSLLATFYLFSREITYYFEEVITLKEHEFTTYHITKHKFNIQIWRICYECEGLFSVLTVSNVDV